MSKFAFRPFASPEVVEPHAHQSGKCPVAGQSHGFCPAQSGDKRAPCPALNALANHGYLPRDGKAISFWQFVSALRKGYNLTFPFALFLTIGTFLLLKKRPQALDLDQLAEHNKIEHDGSLVHKDTGKGQQFAPLNVDDDMVEEVMRWMTTPDEGEQQEQKKGEKQPSTSDASPRESTIKQLGGAKEVITASDVARARVHREKRSAPLSARSAEIARGEMAIALLVFDTPVSLFKGAEHGAPAQWLREWLRDERLPKGGHWRAKPARSMRMPFFSKDTGTPMKKIGLFATKKKAKEMKTAMEAMRARVGKEAQPASLFEKSITNYEATAANPAQADAAKTEMGIDEVPVTSPKTDPKPSVSPSPQQITETPATAHEIKA